MCDFDPVKFCSTLVNGMADAVVYADSEGKIRFWNAGAQRIFGYSPAAAVGQSLDIIAPEGLRKRHWEGYDKTMRTGESRYQNGELLAVPAVRQDGTRISVEFTILPFHDAQGKMAGVAAVMRDVTTKFNELRSLRQQIAGG